MHATTSVIHEVPVCLRRYVGGATHAPVPQEAWARVGMGGVTSHLPHTWAGVGRYQVVALGRLRVTYDTSANPVACWPLSSGNYSFH